MYQLLNKTQPVVDVKKSNTYCLQGMLFLILTQIMVGLLPLATVLIAWLLLGKQLTLGQTVGMSMVMLSITAYAKR